MIFSKEDYLNQKIELNGMDIDWFAIDQENHVGYFTSAGYGPVPKGVNGMAQEFLNLTDRFQNLPERSSTGIEVEQALLDESDVPVFLMELRKEYCEGIKSLGRMGVFCYDAAPREGPGYVRLVVPGCPLTAFEFEAFSNIKTQLIQLPCRFAEMRQLL